MKKDEIVIFENDSIRLQVDLDEDTVWLTQKSIAELFGVKVPAISKHLRNIFNSNELIEEMVVSKKENTTKHGAIEGKTQTKITTYYNLDAILSVVIVLTLIKPHNLENGLHLF